jgi:hypothetical protein
MVMPENQTDEGLPPMALPWTTRKGRTARKTPKEEEMDNGYMWLRLGRQKSAELRKEMAEHRLASRFERPSWAAARVLASVWLVALGAVLFMLAQ